MLTFAVNDMSCGHCVSSITTAIHEIDQGAEVHVDLTTHRVLIRPTASNRAALSDAIREAGYTPVPVDDGTTPVQQSTPRSGCCCR